MISAVLLLAFLTARGFSDGPPGTPATTPLCTPTPPSEPSLWPMEYREKFVQILGICVLMAFVALFIVPIVKIMGDCQFIRKADAAKHHRSV
jgi:hypothetical protein